MSREDLYNNIKETETLEIEEHSDPIVENKESGQEFAEKILNKIKKYMDSFFSREEAIKKIESLASFDDPGLKEQIKGEINLDENLNEIDNEAKVVQTQTSNKVNSVVRDFSKAYHHPEYRKKVAKQIIDARNSGQDPETVRSNFYNKTASEKENFESQEKERSVSEIMKEKDLVIVHAIPLRILERHSTPENNPVLKTGGHQDFKTSVEILAGLSPTISTSIPSPEKSQNGLYYDSGIILGEGKILMAQSRDSGTVAHGLYKRISKYDQSAIQAEIDMDDTVMKGDHYYNELTVENPQIAGLFYDLTENVELPLENPKKEEMIETIRRYNYHGREPSEEEIQKEITDIDKKWEEYRTESQKNQKIEEHRRKFQLYKMKKYSEEFNVPLYIFKKEGEKLKKYRIEFLPRKEENYFLEVIKPKADKLFAEYKKDNDKNKEKIYKNYISSDEFETAKGESEMIEKKDYVLIEVTAKDIYESKREISDKERKKMIEDIKNKGILSASAEKEVDNKFQL